MALGRLESEADLERWLLSFLDRYFPLQTPRLGDKSVTLEKLADEITSGGVTTGPAGGVLSGTYPNPSFASDMATQAELDAASSSLQDAIDDKQDAATAATDAELASHEAATTGVHGLDDKAPLNSPTFTGNPTAPTPAANDNDTSIATTAYVQTELTGVHVPDGNPPASSPTPVVIGAIGFLFVRWAGIVNNDPVTYEVHVSTSSGFTPDSSTLYDETTATQAAVKVDPATGDPLAYDTDYYVRIVAKDVDGAASPGTEDSAQLVQATSPDIASDSILANHILAGEITGDKLSAVVALLSKIQTADSGQRVEIDTQGVRLVGSDDEDLVVLPTDEGQSASFRGDAEFNTAEFIGPATFRNANNAVTAGGEINLDAVQGNPPAAPTLAVTWDSVALTGGVSGSGIGIVYASDGGSGAATACFYTARVVSGSAHVEEWNASTGARIRGLAALDDPPSSLPKVAAALGVAQYSDGGTRKVCALTRVTLTTYVQIVDQATGVLLDYENVTSLLPAPDAPATIGRGSSGPLLVTHAAASDGNLKIHTLNPATGASTGSITTSGLSFSYSGTLLGIVQVGTDYWIAYNIFGISAAFKFNSSGVYQANNDFYLGNGNATGLTHDGTVFRSAQTGASPLVYTHTDWTWTTESAKYWVGYSWTDGSSETMVGPRASIDMSNYRRAKLRITPATRPSGITATRYYAGRGASDPGGTGSSGVQRQTTTSYIDSETNSSALMKNFLSAGDDGPASNGFAASGSPAKIGASGGTGYLVTSGPTLKGDGELRLPVATNTQRGTLAASAGNMIFNSTNGQIEVYDGTRWLPTDWTSLSLENSWVVVSGYATPAWMIDSNGFVHIRGGVQSGSSASATIATLPAEARPGTTKRFAINSTAAAASFQITSAGVMRMNAGGSTSSVILDGITPYEAGG